MPVALGFLYLLAISDVLPEPVRASRRIFAEEIRLDGTLRFLGATFEFFDQIKKILFFLMHAERT